MISQINFQKFKLDLLTLADTNKSIYFADSLHLIIGSNGSGKTHALRMIISSLTGNIRDRDTCQILFQKNEDKEQLGLIYYTCIPYPVTLPRQSTRFTNAAIWASRRPNIQINLNHFESISKALDIKTRPLASYKFNIENLSKLIAGALVDNANIVMNESSPLSIHAAFEEFKRIKNDQKNNQKKRFDSGHDEIEKNYVKTWEDDYKNLQKQRDKLNNAIHNFLKNFAVDMHNFSLIVSFEEMINSNKQNNTFVIAFLERYCGFGFEHSRKITKTITSKFMKLERSAEIKNALIQKLSNWPVNGLSSSWEKFWEIKDQTLLTDLTISKNYRNLKITWENMSSGQLGLLYQFSQIETAAEELLNNGKKSLLILIDEGDLFLHIEWQRKYIELLNLFIKNLKYKFSEVQVILTSHSPMLLTDFPSSCVTRLDNNDEEMKTFAAPLQLILNKTLNSMSIGSFSESLIIEMVKRIRSGQQTLKDEFILSIIDDQVLRREIDKLISETKIDDY